MASVVEFSSSGRIGKDGLGSGCFRRMPFTGATTLGDEQVAPGDCCLGAVEVGANQCAGTVGCRPGIPVTLAKSSVARHVAAERPLAISAKLRSSR